MKLNKVDFYLDWPVSIEVKTLRKYVIANLAKKGQVIRWSIIDIQNSMDANNTKKIRIHAVLAY
tara:strand:- start:398 stop:589 length:192 start_codon:yes stop_codon:yes gene_type:complete